MNQELLFIFFGALIISNRVTGIIKRRIIFFIELSGPWFDTGKQAVISGIVSILLGLTIIVFSGWEIFQHSIDPKKEILKMIVAMILGLITGYFYYQIMSKLFQEDSRLTDWFHSEKPKLIWFSLLLLVMFSLIPILIFFLRS